MSQYATVTFNIAGRNIAGTVEKSASGEIGHLVSVAVAESGTLTTRTSATEADLTMAEGHSIETGDTVDVYWTGGLRYGVTVGTVAGTTVPISGGTGDDLPDAETSLTVAAPQVLDTDFDGSKLELLAMTSSQRGHVIFKDSNGANAYVAELLAATPNFWIDDGVATNPLADDGIDEVHVSNSSAATASTFTLGVAYNSDT